VGTELKVELFEPDADPEAVDELTRHLRLELLELDVDSVSPVVAGPAPAGSKGLELAAIGALLVQVAGSVDAVSTVVSTLRSWLRRGGSSRRSLKISVDGHTLELTSATDAQQQQLVDEFVRALAAPG
jgi:hypothetical protein